MIRLAFAGRRAAQRQRQYAPYRDEINLNTICLSLLGRMEIALFDHISLGVRSLERSAAFYDAALAALGYVRLFESVRAVCYGPRGFKGEAPFAIIKWGEDAKAPGPGFHLAFAASSRDAVDQFHKSALEMGGVDEGPPGIRENYDPGYYAAFVRDPDGHRLEAVLHEPLEPNFAPSPR